MNTPCPECQTALTPSIMGHLCHGCGAVYSFEKMSSMKASSGSTTAGEEFVPAKETTSKQKPSIADSLAGEPELSRKRSGVKHHVKKFLVPEIAQLPKPIDENHLLSNDATVANDNASSAKAAVAATSLDAESKALGPQPTQEAAPAKAIAEVDSKSATDPSTAPTAAGSFDEYMTMIGDIDDKPSSSSVHQKISYAPVKKNYVPIAASILVAVASLVLVVLLAFST
ncbi:MAG: hypothetical protein NT114_03175 [Patescibacteria group bacterium]|nr:hypothetical protein [Patescibacteria group bacterium]